MSSRRVLVANGLVSAVLVCAPACAPPDVCGPLPSTSTSSLAASSGRGVFAHAHNDYEHERPLQDALDHEVATFTAWAQGRAR